MTCRGILEKYKSMKKGVVCVYYPDLFLTYNDLVKVGGR